jgi:hypothetical protein
MDGSSILIMFVFVIMGVIYVTQKIQRALQDKEELKYVYKSSISEQRSKYLSDVFGIRKWHCDELTFDGYNFNFIDRVVHYEDIASISRLNSQTVEIHNQDLPHYSYWLHQRVDGGPDRRYSYNYKVRKSNKMLLLVQKKDGSSFNTTIYGNYIDSETSLDALNKFLNSPSRAMRPKVPDLQPGYKN